MKSYKLSIGFFYFILFYSALSFAMLKQQGFRCYDDPEKKDFYEAQHKNQTVDFVKSQKEQLERIMHMIFQAKSLQELRILEQEGHIRLLSLWQTLLELDKLIDESDPDTSLPNSIHALQSAEAIRADLPNIALELGVAEESISWFVLVGLLHDMGKIDALLRKVPQWAVVGDTFPVGCRFSEENIFYDAFKHNPDSAYPDYQTELGIYKKNIGISNLLMAYGHDEYAFRVLSTQSSLPKEALDIIRFHSFYPLHTYNSYKYFLEDQDNNIIKNTQIFNRYDLYTKKDSVPEREKLKEYYKKLINKYFEPMSGHEEKLIAWPILKDVFERD